MTYLIKQVAWHPFNNDIQILHEDGRLIYMLKATGPLIYRFLFPNFSVLDHSSIELMQATRGKSLRHKSHVMSHEKKSLGFVEQKSLHSYLIHNSSAAEYHIHVAGKIKGWDLTGPEGTVAHIVPSAKKWGWRIDFLLDQMDSLVFLVGIALIYSYIQDVGP